MQSPPLADAKAILMGSGANSENHFKSLNVCADAPESFIISSRLSSLLANAASNPSDVPLLGFPSGEEGVTLFVLT